MLKRIVLLSWCSFLPAVVMGWVCVVGWCNINLVYSKELFHQPARWTHPPGICGLRKSVTVDKTGLIALQSISSEHILLYQLSHKYSCTLKSWWVFMEFKISLFKTTVRENSWLAHEILWSVFEYCPSYLGKLLFR